MFWGPTRPMIVGLSSRCVAAAAAAAHMLFKLTSGTSLLVCLLLLLGQALQEGLEVPNKPYPLTKAVMHLVQSLLNQQCTWGMVPSLVSYTLHRVLGAVPWLPFNCAAARMSLAAAALGVVRAAIVSGAVARPGAAGPKAAGAPGGMLVTVLAAKVIHDMATAGEQSTP